MSTLEDLESGLDDACMSTLGDSISYTPAGGSALAIKAYVNHEEVARSLDNGAAIEQAMTLEIQRSAIPLRPASGDRITLAKVAGKTFKPANVTLNPGGTHWIFELVKV